MSTWGVFVNFFVIIFCSKFENIFLSTEVINLEEKDKMISVTFKNGNKLFQDSFEVVLVSIGRTPNTKSLNLDKTGIKVDKRGFIPVNSKMRTITDSLLLYIPRIKVIEDHRLKL